MSIAPEETRKKWRERSHKIAMNKLANLLDLRELVEDAEAEGMRVKMQLIAEAAEDWGMHPDSVRADLATIRNYSPEQLSTWITNRVAFAHIDAANRLQTVAKKTPKQLLDQAYQLGNENGKTMTVQELEAFALGETEPPPIMLRVDWIFKKLGKFPTLLKWDEVKRARYEKIITELQELFQ